MSTYKEIRGLKVRDYTTNPDNPIEGQLWYNKTDQVARYQIPNVLSSWRSGNDMNRTAQVLASGIGIQTASLAIGGSQTVANVENYNGTNWTEVNDLNTGRKGAMGTGTTTTGLVSGGDTGPTGSGNNGVTNVESWNGSSFSETTDINTARYVGAGAGPSTASLIYWWLCWWF